MGTSDNDPSEDAGKAEWIKMGRPRVVMIARSMKKSHFSNDDLVPPIFETDPYGLLGRAHYDEDGSWLRTEWNKPLSGFEVEYHPVPEPPLLKEPTL